MPRQQLRHRLNLLKIPTGDRRVDLDRQLQLSGVVQHLPRPLEAAVPAPKGVVGLRISTVQADPQGLDTGAFDRLKRLPRGQRSRRGSQGDAQPERDGVVDQRQQIRTLQGIPSGQNQVWFLGKARHLVDQVLGLRGGQFFGICLLLCRGATVQTNQITGLCDFVIEHQGPRREVVDCVGVGVFRRMIVHSGHPDLFFLSGSGETHLRQRQCERGSFGLAADEGYSAAQIAFAE